MVGRVEYMPFFALTAYGHCQRQWEFAIIHGVKTSTPPTLLLWSVFQDTLLTNFAFKARTGDSLDLEFIDSTFRETWDKKISSEDIDWGDSDRKQLKLDCKSAIDVYMDKMADFVDPREVNVPWGVTVNGAKITGRISMKLINGHYLELTLGGKSTSQNDLDKSSKATAVAASVNKPIVYHKHISVQTKEPKVDHKKTTRTLDDIAKWKTITGMIIDQMNTGIAIPNCESWMCNPKSCQYYEICQEELSAKTFDMNSR